MNNTFIWWNLPAQIKEKLNITLLYNWFKIPTEINVVLRGLEQTKPNCYAQYFEPAYKVNWFTLLADLENVCNIIDCTE